MPESILDTIPINWEASALQTVVIRVITFIAFGLGGLLASVAEAQTLTAVQSRKTHAAVGALDLRIDNAQPIGGAVTVEPRAIGNGHTIVFQFDAPAVAPSSVTAVDSQGLMVGNVNFSTSGAEVSVNLTGIADNSRVTVSLRDGVPSVYASASVGFFVGDVNNTRAVNANDVSAVKARSGQAANATNFMFDVGTSGSVNAADIAAVKSRVGQILAPAGQAGLSIVSVGSGSGTVSSAPIGITCPGTCSSNFAFNTTVTLSATPNPGSTFSGWAAPCTSGTINLAVSTTCSATFTANTYAVTSSAGANGTISPATTQTINYGATPAFTVTPNTGYAALVGGTCVGNLVGTTYTINPVTASCSVVASFVTINAYFVATTGSDTTGTGSITSPWKTIGFAIGRMVSGDLLIVRTGIYTGLANFIANVPSGTASRYTTIMAETPMDVRIQSNTTLQYDDNQMKLSGNYIKVDGFIFDMAGTLFPPYNGSIDGNFNKLTRSIFKRSGNIDEYGGLLELNGNDNLVEDTAGVGACRYCFKQGGTTQVTQRNIWRRVVARFDYSNSPQPKATFSTYGNDSVATNGVFDHLYQNAIAIDGQNPGTNGGEEKYGGFYTIKAATRVTLQGSMVLNEGVGYSGMHLRDYAIGLTSNVATNSVVWNLPGSQSFAVGVKGQPLDHLTIGGSVPSSAYNLNDPAPTVSLLKPSVAPVNLLNNTPGAVVLKRYGVTGTRWGEPGYDQLTTEDLWPWAYQDKIKAVFREVNNVPSGNNPSTNNTLRGFAANGNGLYGGPITLTSYIWEMTGTPCPPTVCF